MRLDYHKEYSSYKDDPFDDSYIAIVRYSEKLIIRFDRGFNLRTLEEFTI